MTVPHRNGEAFFVGQDNWFARTPMGASNLQTLVFQLTCAPGAAIVAVTPPLPGVSRSAPQVMYYSESRYAPGDATSAQTYSGSTVEYVFEGSITQQVGGVSKTVHAGQFTEVVPAGTTSSLANTGPTPARTFTMQIYPASQPRVVAAGPAAPRALPNTGDDLGAVAGAGALAGLVLLAGGRLHLRRR